MNTVFLTKCCDAFDTFWGDVHVCRKCHREDPLLVEVSTSEDHPCCAAPRYLGHMFGCPNSMENKK